MGWFGLVWAGLGWFWLVWADVGWCGLVWVGLGWLDWFGLVMGDVAYIENVLLVPLGKELRGLSAITSGMEKASFASRVMTCSNVIFHHSSLLLEDCVMRSCRRSNRLKLRGVRDLKNRT